MNNQLDLLKALQNAEQKGGTVTYHFEDGTKQVQNINKKLFTNEKGRTRDLTDVVNIINGISHDLGAISFVI